MRPDVAVAFDRMAAAARREAGLYLSISSAFRSDAEQAKLFAEPQPEVGGPAGHQPAPLRPQSSTSAAHPWLQENHCRFGFIWRYRWEPSH
jgi:LAS superfamily LD-carboxypeptidase LdcB